MRRLLLILFLAALAIAAPASAKRPKPLAHRQLSYSGRFVVQHPLTLRTAVGTLTGLTDESVTVHNDDGDLTCKRAEYSPALGDFHVGDAVKVGCTDGVLTAIAKVETRDVRTESGTLVELTDTSLTLQMLSGRLTCTRGEHSPALGDFHVGDRVKVVCTNGVLTSIAKADDVTVKRQGTITSLSDASLTVHNGDGDLTCTRGDRSPALGDFHVGDLVKVACTNRVLTAIAKVQADVYTGGIGAITALSSSALSIHTDGGDLTCRVTADSPALGDLHQGDTVKVYCKNGVLFSIAKVQSSTDVVVTRQGTLSALSESSLTVHNGDGDLTCTRNDRSPSLGEFHVGDVVKVACTDGVLTAIAKVSVDVYTGGIGALTALSSSSFTVHTDGGDLTCAVTADSPSLADFHVGDTAKLYCKNGVLFWIAKLFSGTTAGTLSAMASSLTVHNDGGEVTCLRTNTSPSLDGYAVGNNVRATCVNGVLTAIAHV